MNSSKRYFPELDGVRGLAIMMVFGFHTLPQWSFWGSQPLNLISHSLWLGVDLFFVLSGFLITRILLATRSEPHRFQMFYTRRALRIFPLYFAALSLLLWVLPAFALPEIRRLQPLWPYFYGYALNGWIWAHNAWPPSGMLNHLWSLAVEEQFYLVWPLLIFSLRRERLPLAIGLICAFSWAAKLAFFARGASWGVLYTHLWTRMDALALGALAALIFGYYASEKADRIAKIAFQSVGGALVLAFVALRGFISSDRLTLVVVTPLVALFFSAGVYLLLRSAPDSRAKRFFSLSFLGFFGRYSYGLYVFHWPIFNILRQSSLFAAREGDLVASLALFGLTGALSLGLAVLSYHAFELQFLKLRPEWKPVERGTA